MTPLLSARHLHVAIDQCPLLEDISLDILAGQMLAIIGPNGAGKTSLMRALTGDLPCQQGEIRFDGGRWADKSPQVRARQLAFLPQHNPLNFPFIVEDVVAMGRIPHQTGLQLDREIVQAALMEMDALHLKGRLYTHLSGGEKQRVHLARVLTQIWREQDGGPRLLVLDEPTSSLDVAHAQQLMQALRRFAERGVAVVFIVHDFNLASRYADQIVALCRGRLAAQGSPQAVMTTAVLQTIFQVDTSIVSHPVSGRPMVMIND